MEASALALPAPVKILPIAARFSTLLAPSKRNICVFDPRKNEHYRYLRKLLGSLAAILWFERFSKNSLESGEMAQGVRFEDIERLNPAVIIAELELIAKAPDWRDGISLLENFRRNQRFDSGTSLIVISNHNAIFQAHTDFERLGVASVFTWDGLSIQEIRHKFLTIVRGQL
jgi:hypothetical protein